MDRGIRGPVSEPVPVDDPGTCIPAEDRVLIIGVAERLGLRIRLHRLNQEVVHDAGIGSIEQQALGPAAEQHALVIELRVLVREAAQERLCFVLAHPEILGIAWDRELIGDRKNQDLDGVGVLRVNGEDITADALSASRLIEQPVPLGLRQRSGDRLDADLLQFVHWLPLQSTMRSL